MTRNFETSLIHTGLYKELVPYLHGNDLIHLLLMNKYIDDEGYIKKYLNKKSSCIIRLFKKYHTLNSFILTDFNILTHNHFKVHRRFLDCQLARKYQAMTYYAYYERKYRYSWYNKQTGWKKDIIDFHKKKHTNTPSKYDLYILVKSMSVTESMTVGW